MSPSMLEAVEMYGAAASATVSRVCVEDMQVQAFSRGVTNFLRRLGDDAADEYWAPVTRRLRRVRWELATTPLPINHEALGLSESAAFVATALRACDRIYPTHAAGATAVSQQLEELAGTATDPLGTAIAHLLAPGAVDSGAEGGDGAGEHEAAAGDLSAAIVSEALGTRHERSGSPPAAPPKRGDATTAIVLPRSRHTGAVEGQLASAGFHVTVVTPAQLAQTTVYDRAIIVGAVAWYPSHVLAAPRAHRLHVVQYGWIRDDVPEASLFAGSEGRAPTLPPLERPPGSPIGESDAHADPDELLPLTDWAAIGATSPTTDDSSAVRTETVQAYLLLLASDEAVYLEAEEGSRAYVVALGAEKELRQIPTRSIAPGTYLITREGGEGDYIAAIADSLLGVRASDLRAAQRRWKGMLQELVQRVGLHALVRRLKEAGAPRATEMNARRWASEASIRTQDYQDFQAIMSVIGLETEAEDLWKQMALIDQAHLRAGQRVRALLEHEILEGDTRELERSGWMDYDVAEIEGEGSLRVARVEARAPDTTAVPARSTRRPFRVERDLWQG
jgi:hypothetical protein